MRSHISTAMLLFLLIAIGLAAGCASKQVRPGPTAEVTEDMKENLEAIGFVCRDQNSRSHELLCEGPRTYKTLFTYFGASRRLQFSQAFDLRTDCTQLHQKILEYNWTYNIAQLSCNEGKLAVVSQTIVPQNGIKYTEIGDYLEWWRDALNDSLEASDLWQYID